MFSFKKVCNIWCIYFSFETYNSAALTFDVLFDETFKKSWTQNTQFCNQDISFNQYILKHLSL